MTGKTTPSLDPAFVRTGIDQTRQSALQIDGLRAANARTILTLEAALNQSIKGALNTHLKPARGLERRTEIRSRIEADEEIRTFILARIKTLTFDQVLAEIAAHITASRQTSRSALHCWWHRYGKVKTEGSIANSSLQPTDPGIRQLWSNLLHQHHQTP